ncbi:MAG: hypothetical protein GTN67_13560 [Hydrotalea flava]|uniref:response regulator n=1 Tax=Hydrotalea TaxID=1004300 RepID=UPI0009435D2C|nr:MULTISPECIES: response regulator [Hydrotalea]NIM36328.1 hypothetical protein [Hydrotalea flava]NIM39183.1 hypothetical protein [Hydrotalea flava]NIN04422.1 hypothetical protein [Hydrotalea flava]NIN16041.1 hypothetical protein [Hydrotalea flava]NIO95109.1 hypothetical protein [Hydrotalea flava]
MSSAFNLVLVDAKPDYLLKLRQMVNTIPFVNILFTANSGADCLKKLQQVKAEPDVIITDLLMPELDGMGLQPFYIIPGLLYPLLYCLS